MKSLIPLVFGVAYTGLWYFFSTDILSTLLLSVGFILGWGVMMFDQNWGYSWYTEQASQALQADNKQLITRSSLFMLSYFVLCLYIFTSTTSFLGWGMLFGIGFTLISEMVLLVSQPLVFRLRFLWQVQHEFESAQLRLITLVFSAIVLYFALQKLLLVL